MNDTFATVVSFIIALFIGIYIGKLLFSNKSNSEKAALEEKINGLLFQIEQFKSQLNQTVQERETIRSEKDALAIQLSKKENDLRFTLRKVNN